MHEVASWTEEKRAAFLYRVIAAVESGTPREKLFLGLAAEAESQAAIWEKKARAAGADIPPFVPDVRSRIVAGLVRRHGPRRLRGVLAAMKVRGMSVYAAGGSGKVFPHRLDDIGHHRGLSGGGNLRAAVFGVNDGLISNASLIMGVAGASADNVMILLTGVAGLVAGAFSMAAGEYVSVRSQREMFEYQIGLERDELAEYPEEEARELALIYEARGIAPGEAQRMAQQIIADPEQALDTLAREELGLNPDDLGSAVGRGAVFVFFVRRRQRDPAAAVCVWRGQREPDDGDRPDRARVVCSRRDVLAVHRPQRDPRAGCGCLFDLKKPHRNAGKGQIRSAAVL